MWSRRRKPELKRQYSGLQLGKITITAYEPLPRSVLGGKVKNGSGGGNGGSELIEVHSPQRGSRLPLVITIVVTAIAIVLAFFL